MKAIVYTLPVCVQCDMTKRMMKRNGIEFTEVDLSQNPEALEMVQGLGYQAAPVVIAGDKSWSGFKPDLVNSLA
jgi:glutaredoxin-like protein NrdH